jgi:hypothetical protein
MITFRNSKIVYYGPHGCDNCGVMIVKMGTEFGGTAFNAPATYAYPNTEWHPHVCDPSAVAEWRAVAGKAGLEPSYEPSARPSWAGTDLDGTISVGYTVDPSKSMKTNAISGMPLPRGVR